MLAFAIIYFVWGSTFLAIRVGVREVPPLLLASMRFFIAGVVLFAWMRLRGTPSPSRREWLAASALAVCIFVVDYGLLFWAEQRVPSGIAAVMLGDHPGLHDAFGDHFSAHAAADVPAGAGSFDRDRRGVCFGEPLTEPEFGRSAYRSCWSGRAGNRCHKLVDCFGSYPQAPAARSRKS